MLHVHVYAYVYACVEQRRAQGQGQRCSMYICMHMYAYVSACVEQRRAQGQEQHRGEAVHRGAEAEGGGDDQEQRGVEADGAPVMQMLCRCYAESTGRCRPRCSLPAAVRPSSLRV